MDRKSRTSRSATLDDTNEEVSLWKQICNALAKLENIQKDTANIVTNINSIHTAVNFNEGIPTSIGARLMDYYRGGIDLSNNEAKTIHDIIEKVSVLVALRDASDNSNNTTHTLNHSILPYGTSVAARQPKQKDKNEEWILAVVLSYHTEKNKYQVEDVDQDDFGQKQRYMLQPRNIIPIPDADEAAKGHTELNSGQDVLALYPGTTCFYRAKIVSAPSKVN
ncbi:SGF29 tudor-like domain-containing protein [Pilaira anomala]|nr:SGF29 tudor-like domain-containing protein [Pilaira anomala]